MLSRSQSLLPVGIRHWGEVAANDLVVGVVFDVVTSHDEHAEMQECDRGEGSASYEKKRGLRWVVHLLLETAIWEGVGVHLVGFT